MLVNRDGVAEGRCCTTLSAKDPQRGSMLLDRRHKQTNSLPLLHHELVPLQWPTEEAWFSADLAGQGHDLARATRRLLRSPCGVLGCGDPVLPDDQGTSQTALTTNNWHGGPLLKLANLDWAVPD
jgi:hypothetical protein